MATFTPLESTLLEQIQSPEMWRHLEELCKYDRLSGSPGERAAMDYLIAQARAYGLNIQVYEFDAYLSDPKLGQLDVLGAEARTVKAKTRSFSASTPAGGIEGELVYVPSAEDMFKDVQTHERIAALNLQSKIVISEAGGRANMITAQKRGAVGYVHVWPSNEPYCHEGTVSPVWGQPTPDTFQLLPRIPVVQITHADGAQLIQALQHHSVPVRLTTKTETGWKKLRLPVVDIPGKRPEFVLIGGHFDSWHLGCTDNATGNVACLELARVFNAMRDQLERGVRVAWWPGHSNGRYTGSTWYADQFWDDLRTNCIGYINIDSPGALGADDYTLLTSVVEAARFVCDTTTQVTGRPAQAERPVRAGDYSFHGIGIPGLHMLMGSRPMGQRAQVGGCGLGWWWHTEEDTLDKADARILKMDTQVYALTAWRLCNADVLPYDLGALAQETTDELKRIQQAAGNAFDLSAALTLAQALASKVERLRAVQNAQVVNRAMMGIIKTITPIDYTVSGLYDHDAAVPAKPFPGLQPAAKLAQIAPDSMDARFLRNHLVRRRNQVCDALKQANAFADEALAWQN